MKEQTCLIEKKVREHKEYLTDGKNSRMVY